MNNEKINICFNCDGIIESPLIHNCIRGLTDNLNRIHANINILMVKKLDHLDGLKYALNIIDEMECHYKQSGIDYIQYHQNPFHDLRNKIRMLLGLPLISR